MKNNTVHRKSTYVLAVVTALAMPLPVMLQAQPVQQHGALAVSGNRIALLVATFGTFILLWTLAPVSRSAFLGANAGLQGAVYSDSSSARSE